MEARDSEKKWDESSARADLNSLSLPLLRTGTNKGSSSFFEAAILKGTPSSAGGLPVPAQVHRETIQYNQNAFVLHFTSLFPPLSGSSSNKVDNTQLTHDPFLLATFVFAASQLTKPTSSPSREIELVPPSPRPILHLPLPSSPSP